MKTNIKNIRVRNNPKLIDIYIFLQNAAKRKDIIQLNFDRGYVIGLIKPTANYEIYSIESKSFQIKFYANEVWDIVSDVKNPVITLVATTVPY